jgi:hypothetical protein
LCAGAAGASDQDDGPIQAGEIEAVRPAVHLFDAIVCLESGGLLSEAPVRQHLPDAEEEAEVELVSAALGFLVRNRGLVRGSALALSFAMTLTAWRLVGETSEDYLSVLVDLVEAALGVPSTAD